MNNFKAYRNGNKVVIDGAAEYHQGQLLTHYLNADFTKLEQMYLASLKNGQKVLYPYGDREYDYNKVVYAVQGFFDYVETLAAGLPPYNKSPKQPSCGALFSLLNTQPILFRDFDKEDDNLPYDFDALGLPDDSDLDDYDIDNAGIDHEARYRRKSLAIQPHNQPGIIINDFTPAYFSDRLEPLAIELNKRIKRLYDRYMTFAAGILRVKLYSDFLDGYIHKGNAFQDQARLAQAFLNFQDDLKKKAKLQVYQRFAEAADISVTHGVLEIEDGRGNKRQRLWEITEHDGIGSFLYSELFGGLQSGFLPKRCHNCGRYFLLTSGYTPDFCDELAPGETEKTCRDIGARKKYDEKIKNDPIWLAYQRAYKARYGRVSKKKITKAEFTVWADKAIALRGMALSGELSFDEYAAALRE